MFAPKKPGLHSVPNLTRIVAVIFALLLASRVLLRAQDTTPTNPTLVSLVTLTVLAVIAYARQGDGKTS
jgi:CHASE2 domain-containing sensor protein